MINILKDHRGEGQSGGILGYDPGVTILFAGERSIDPAVNWNVERSQNRISETECNVRLSTVLG